MILNQEYSIQKIVKLSYGYGGNVIFFLRNIRDASSKLYKLFFPIKYSDVASNTDMEEINNEKI